MSSEKSKLNTSFDPNNNVCLNVLKQNDPSVTLQWLLLLSKAVDPRTDVVVSNPITKGYKTKRVQYFNVLILIFTSSSTFLIHSYLTFPSNEF